MSDIFNPCDIRGNATEQLSSELYVRFGLALGKMLHPGDTVVVGSDRRATSPAFRAALIDGLRRAPVHIVDLRAVPTPLVYFAKRHLKADACAIVTASHNKPEDNGLKWLIGRNPPNPDQVAVFKATAEDESKPPPFATDEEPETRCLQKDYIAALQERWHSAALDLRVVVDPMHGCWSRLGRVCLHAVFPRLMIEAIHDRPSPTFEGLSPDPSVPANIRELSETVERERASLGFAFDGDGDRMALVDEFGTILSAEETAWCFLKTFGDELQGKNFVHDVKFSDRLATHVKSLGAKPCISKTGHAFVRREMYDNDAIFGAEVSGHFYFGEIEAADDGVFAACRILDYLGRTGKSLSALREECPPLYLTSDLRVGASKAVIDAVMLKMETYRSELERDMADGVRIRFKDGFILTRRSGTEPKMTFRFEAGSSEALEERIRQYCADFPEIGDDLWEKYLDSF
jgi:phosphomannomutase / phosphoglucomutase